MFLIPNLDEPEPYRGGKWPLAASHGHGIRTERVALRSRKRPSPQAGSPKVLAILCEAWPVTA